MAFINKSTSPGVENSTTIWNFPSLKSRLNPRKENIFQDYISITFVLTRSRSKSVRNNRECISAFHGVRNRAYVFLLFLARPGPGRPWGPWGPSRSPRSPLSRSRCSCCCCRRPNPNRNPNCHKPGPCHKINELLQTSSV